nr:MAG TPA: hypothetical protein [Caudoviricetes sp.]
MTCPHFPHTQQWPCRFHSAYSYQSDCVQLSARRYFQRKIQVCSSRRYHSTPLSLRRCRCG